MGEERLLKLYKSSLKCKAKGAAAKKEPKNTSSVIATLG
jgi:hypothetical protein